MERTRKIRINENRTRTNANKTMQNAKKHWAKFFFFHEYLPQRSNYANRMIRCRSAFDAVFTKQLTTFSTQDRVCERVEERSKTERASERMRALRAAERETERNRERDRAKERAKSRAPIKWLRSIACAHNKSSNIFTISFVPESKMNSNFTNAKLFTTNFACERYHKRCNTKKKE